MVIIKYNYCYKRGLGMNKKIITLPLLLTLVASPLLVKQNYQPAKAISAYKIATSGSPTLITTLPTTIDLNPVNASEVRNYYSSIAGLSESERKGTNLLKNLKSILYDMNYFKYGGISSGKANGVTAIYTITDRDWEHSPASAITTGTFNSSTNQITDFNHGNESQADPYVKMLYVDYTKQATTKFKKDASNPNFDKEHVWCQSRGFKGGGEGEDAAMGPAGTDLHHLIAGDSFVNQTVHNDNPYGFVATKNKEGNLSYTINNRNGTAVHTSSQDESTTVFEPQDCDKGDIARAIFYMAARYNNYSGVDTISKFEPFLALANYATGSSGKVYSTETTPVTMGILSDLLAWNKIDPVDDYEIRRNDLIYRNYQGNRNPFIDFPQWADCIWGTANDDGSGYDSTISKAANPNTDRLNDSGLSISHRSINLAPGETQKISATTVNSSNVTWAIGDAEVVELSKTTSSSGEEIELKALKVGKTKITVSATIDEQLVSKEITITVAEKPKINYVLYIAIGAGVLVLAIIVIIIYSKGNKKTKKKIASAVKKTVKSYTSSSSSSSKKSSSSGKKKSSSSKKK